MGHESCSSCSQESGFCLYSNIYLPLRGPSRAEKNPGSHCTTVLTYWFPDCSRNVSAKIHRWVGVSIGPLDCGHAVSLMVHRWQFLFKQKTRGIHLIMMEKKNGEKTIKETMVLSC